MAGTRSNTWSESGPSNGEASYQCFLLQIDQNSKWTQEVGVKKLKDNIEPKKPVTWQRPGRRLSERLVTSLSLAEARKKNFSVRNLTESELNFLLEYVCNS